MSDVLTHDAEDGGSRALKVGILIVVSLLVSIAKCAEVVNALGEVLRDSCGQRQLYEAIIWSEAGFEKGERKGNDDQNKTQQYTGKIKSKMRATCFMAS